ncbi:hypothetical protein L218DRAFT_29755 [Marasmius fiardii PR-910]|nr:hypothetical protein L218DRAFT_29755 [Marasmius fiardii PR-910]
MLVKALVLSDDSAIESVLSEIPFFCAGLVAFALSTFFLVMKRINLLSVYLYSSAIFAFGAAVLDLSQLLTRGANNIIQGTGTEAVRAIINTREVGFSISVGLRFLFFWKFVAERPRGEPPPLGPSLYTYNPWEQSHSASWKRWGYLGLFLKWSLLLATLALPILQILWRIVFRTIGPVYLVESTMQIVISALFMMKLLLNIFLSPVFPRSKAVASNLAPFLALGLNLGIGIGSLILFLFSETTLGRFLQAVELYFLMLFILISTFYNVPRRPPRADTTSYIVSPPEKSMQAPPAELSPTSVSVEDTSVQRRTSRRLSSWILAARRSSRAASGVRWLVTPDDVERDGSGNQQTKLTTEAHPEVKVQDEGIPWSGSLPSPLVTTPTRTQDGALAQLRGTDFSLSYYGATQPRDSGLSLDTHPPISKRDSRLGAESPVYGLNGIVNQSNARKSQTSFSSLDELLRQQNELDKSIANLRLFSTQATLGVPDSGRVVSSDSKPPRTESRTFSSTSNPSVFSLSVFPDPPKFSESERTFHTSRVSTLRTKRNTLSISQRDTLHNNGFVSRPQPGRLDSAGTSYDVTSFIGGKCPLMIHFKQLIRIWARFNKAHHRSWT